VFPSWLEGQAPRSWSDLPRLIETPEEVMEFNPNVGQFIDERSDAYEWRRLGVECHDGAWGWGILSIGDAERHPWVGDWVLKSVGDVMYPALMDHIKSYYKLPVTYIDPPNRAVWLLGLGARPRRYVCRATVEHSDRANGGIYLLAIAKSKIVGSDLPLVGCRQFGLSIRQISEPPSALASEVRRWLGAQPDDVHIWFEIDENGSSVAWLFATMLYSAFHWKRIASSRLVGVHLIAEIEGEPRVLSDLG